jgi:hypothetical protein
VVPERSGEAPAAFDRAQSAALFVGVRYFDDRSVVPVRYAIDDAVDLAWVFALDPRIALVPPQRVVLALSGAPSKESSQRHLRELREAGAITTKAEQSNIVRLLRRQAALAGPNGLLVVSFATHGFSREGTPYVLASSSLLQRDDTALSTASILDIIGTSPARRSLVFLDACRERVTRGERSRWSRLLSVAPLLRAMARVEGQAVFYAAAAGKNSYDDPERRNGVFTAAVVDGLQCGAAKQRFVTAETLADFVEERVRLWIREHRDPNVRNATQVSFDGETAAMPLAYCPPPPPPAPPLPQGPTRLETHDGALTALDDKAALWHYMLDAPISRAELVDVDEDGRNEVIAIDGERLTLFSAAGLPLWSHSGVRTFVTANLQRKHTRQVVALTADGVAVFDANGKLLCTYRGELQQLLVGARTSRHVPRIIAAGVSGEVVVLEPRSARRVWSGALVPPQPIARIEVVDRGNGRRDIAITPRGGGKVYVDFDGRLVAFEGGVRFATH